MLAEKFLSSSTDHVLSTLIGVEEKLGKVSSTSTGPCDLSTTTLIDSNDTSPRIEPAQLLSDEVAEALDTLLQPSQPMHIFAYTMHDRINKIFKCLGNQIRSSINNFLSKAAMDSTFSACLVEISWLLAILRAVQKEKENTMLYVSKVSHSTFSALIFHFGEYDFNLTKSIETLHLLVSKTDHDSESVQCSKVSPAESISIILRGLLATLPLLTDPINPEENGRSLPWEAVMNSRVIFSTLSSSGHALMKQGDHFCIDILLVDEAAQALEAELAIAIQRGRPSRMILVGDPNQLPATLMSMEAQQAGHGVSTMQRLIDLENAHSSGLTQSVSRNEQKVSRYSLLNTQYRMDPEISIFPNTTFYQGRLFDSEHVTERASLEIAPLFRTEKYRFLDKYSFIDITGYESVSNAVNPSIKNVHEARAIAR